MGAAGKDSGCNSMRVGLIDVDGHNFPNIPLMKLSAWHKQQGDTVEWYEPLFSGHMNRVYMSKVFSFTQDYPYFVDADEVVRGGSGYCIELTDGREHYQKERDKELPPEVEHIYPDYSIYPELTQDKAFGFLTRGCPRGCEFCHVGCKEGKRSHKVADLSEFWRGQKNIVLCDPNTLACPEHMELLQQLKDSKARVNFNQGLDIRLMNERNIELLKQIKLETIHVAYDRYTDKDIIEAKMKMFKEMTGYNKDRGRVMVYILCNFDTTIEQDIERIQFCRSLEFIRYMDDMVVFGKNKKELHRMQQEIERFLREKFNLQMKGNWQVFRFDYTEKKTGKRKGRPLDFMGFQFYHDKTILRESIMLSCTRKVNRVAKKEKITWYDATAILSYMGYLSNTDTYDMYLQRVKPYVNVKKLKKIVSKHSKRKEREKHERMERSVRNGGRTAG